MRIALAQLNPIVGDVAGNALLVKQAIDEARGARADLLVTSELVLIGYPPRDLLQREGIVEACEAAVRDLARHAGEMRVIVGHPRRGPSGPGGGGGLRPWRNSASLLHQGKIIAVCDKQLLPGYDVFDEDRYFEPGGRSLVVEIRERRVGIVICEDLWRAQDVTAERGYLIEPVAELAAQKCDLIVSLNASPFVIGKWRRHLTQLAEVAGDCRVPIVAVNQAGANDDLIFDGRSVVVGPDGSVIAALPGFAPAVQTIDLTQALEARAMPADAIAQWDDANRETYHALVLGLRDYCRKTNHAHLWLGLSGGVDSALTAVLASAALGAANVRGVMMPSRYSSTGSIDDAREVAQRLGMKAPQLIPILGLHQAMAESLDPALGEDFCGLADENVQARLRGVMLMALSNARGGLVLATSNKSELAMGYSTLYGDMCGALAPLGDLTKTRIYSLARWINDHHRELGFAAPQPPIPEPSISKPPSAELRPNQTDQDTLPPYDLLDQIIERAIELEQSVETIIAETGFDAALVRRTVRSIDLAEYKRHQSPVILKVTGRAFGRGRPMPIVMRPA